MEAGHGAGEAAAPPPGGGGPAAEAGGAGRLAGGGGGGGGRHRRHEAVTGAPRLHGPAPRHAARAIQVLGHVCGDTWRHVAAAHLGRGVAELRPAPALAGHAPGVPGPAPAPLQRPAALGGRGLGGGGGGGGGGRAEGGHAGAGPGVTLATYDDMLSRAWSPGVAVVLRHTPQELPLLHGQGGGAGAEQLLPRPLSQRALALRGGGGRVAAQVGGVVVYPPLLRPRPRPRHVVRQRVGLPDGGEARRQGRGRLALRGRDGGGGVVAAAGGGGGGLQHGLQHRAAAVLTTPAPARPGPEGHLVTVHDIIMLP